MFRASSGRQRRKTVVVVGIIYVLGALGLVVGGSLLAAGQQAWAAIDAPSVGRSYAFLPFITREGGAISTSSAWSAPLAVGPIDGLVWVVNPDAGSVSVVDPTNHTTLAELPAGQEPWSIAIAPSGERVYVVDRANGTLLSLDAESHRLVGTVAVGPEPGGVVLSATGATAYVALTSTDEVVVVDTARLAISARVAVAARPYALAITNNGDGADDDEHVYVTHLLALPQPGKAEATDDGRAGQVTVIAAATNTVAYAISLSPDQHGFPNMLTGIAIHGNRAWLPHVRAAPALPNGLTTTVFAAVATLDLPAKQEQIAARLDLNDEEVFGSPVNNPMAAVPAPDGKTLYVVLAGSDVVEVVDVAVPERPRLIKFLPTGKNPRGMVISPDGRRGYVMNYLGRSLTVLDLEQLQALEAIPVVAETLDPQVLRGKLLFNTAVVPQMARVSWLSCASCHLDGGTDGVTWMYPDGPRQSPPLWKAAQTLPWHWSAALDELQDVEDTVHTIQFGLGLAPGSDPPLLGPPNAGRSSDLDALAAFLARGIRTPATPPPTGDLAEGRRVFVTAGCAGCHAGPNWTTSALPGTVGTLDPDGNGMIDGVLRDVGTLNPTDVRGATGFDVPSLLNVGLTAPYLHDGSAASLPALLMGGHPRSAVGTLSTAEITQLVAFLRTIGPTTPPFAVR